MKDDDWFVTFAISAYYAYRYATTHRPPNTPNWEDLTPEMRSCWIAAVKQIFRDLQVNDVITGEPYVALWPDHR